MVGKSRHTAAATSTSNEPLEAGRAHPVSVTKVRMPIWEDLTIQRITILGSSVELYLVARRCVDGGSREARAEEWPSDPSSRVCIGGLLICTPRPSSHRSCGRGGASLRRYHGQRA